MNRDAKHTWGHTISFGEEYLQNAQKMLRQIRADAVLLAQVAAQATEAVRAGRKVYANCAIGHMPRFELHNEREGNPRVLCMPDGGECTPEQLAILKDGDVLLTGRVNAAIRRARDAGVYVVVFTTCYVNNRNVPPGEVRPNENDWMPEDVASLVIDSHIPWESGLVHMPAIPEMPVCPGVSIGGCAIQWMLSAEVAHALETGKTPDGRIGIQYVDVLLQRLTTFRTQQWEQVSQTASTIAERIIASGHLTVRSRNEGVESECSTVAQGLMLCNAFAPRAAAAGGAMDTLLIAAVTAEDPAELAWADEARANGHLIVGVGPTNNQGLRQRCDVYFDNGCDGAAGVIEIPGREQWVCPTTGIANLVITYVITAQFVDEMCRRGAVPYFWMGRYRMQGPEYNDLMEVFFGKRGY